MNKQIIKIGLETGMLNYIDETPRHYFLSGFANEEDLELFAQSIIRECASIYEGVYTDQQRPERIDTRIKEHFGVE
jgi:hypothetical protein